MKSAKALLIISLLVPSTMFGMLRRVNHLRNRLSSRIKTSAPMRNALRNKHRVLPILLQKRWNSNVSNTEKIKELEERKKLMEKGVLEQIRSGLSIVAVCGVGGALLLGIEPAIMGTLTGSAITIGLSLPKSYEIDKIKDEITLLKNREFQANNDEK